jgi:hypothetical protein
MEEARAGNPAAVKAIDARPEIEPYLIFVWDAFRELCSDRPVSAMGIVSAIPFSSIDRYAARVGLCDIDAFSRFLILIRRMDAAYLDHVKKAAG